MNDDDLALRIYARAERRPRMLVRPARVAGREMQELPAARPDGGAVREAEPAVAEPAREAESTGVVDAGEVGPAEEAEPAGETGPAGEAEPAEETGPAGEAGPPEHRTGAELSVPAEASVEDRVLRILRAPPEWGETVEGAFTRKERELAAVFAALEPAEAGELFRRLSSPRGDDPIAVGFARLVPERRGRLLGLLIGAPRRAALARARRLPPQPRRRDG